MFLHYLWLLHSVYGADFKNKSLEYELQQLAEKVAHQERQSQHLSRLEDQLRAMVLNQAPKPRAPADSWVTLDALKQQESNSLEAAMLRSRILTLGEEAQNQALSLTYWIDFLSKDKEFRMATPSILPAKGQITSGFGARMDPVTGEQAVHMGIDIGVCKGTKVTATAAGRVVFFGENGALGNTIIVDHGFGTQTHYGHLERALAKVGDQVERGQAIALSGNTGKSTGPHLHYEVRRYGIPQDPMQFILD